MTLRRVQYTGKTKKSLNEYKNMHYSLHFTRVVRAIVSGLVAIFSVCVWEGGGEGGRVNEGLYGQETCTICGINPYIHTAECRM